MENQQPVLNQKIYVDSDEINLLEYLYVLVKNKWFIISLTREIINQVNPKATIEVEEERIRPAKSEVERLLGSKEKISQLTQWKPTYDLTTGLKETIAWFSEKDNLQKYKANIYNY